MVDAQTSLLDFLSTPTARGPFSGAAVLERVGLVRDDALRLHAWLEHELDYVALTITDNRKRMVSTRQIGAKKRYEVRLHHMFVGASREIAVALGELARGSKEAKAVVLDFIEGNRERIDRQRANVRPDGTHFDLEALLVRAHEAASLTDLDLELGQDIRISWARKSKPRRSIRFGSFDFERRLIRIHPKLDAAWVSELFVEFVVYHELLHALIPPEHTDEGVRRLHTPRFREYEAMFPGFEEANAWENANLRRFLKA